MRQKIKEVLEKHFGADHGYISDGLGDVTHCECDHCFNIAEASSELETLFQKEKNVNIH